MNEQTSTQQGLRRDVSTQSTNGRGAAPSTDVPPAETPTQVHPTRVETLIIGGGQSGLSIGYQLSQRNRPFLIVDANDRVGDSWRERWDSLRLFTPAKFNGLAGMPFPARGDYFPTKDEMADFLESYVERFDLPVQSGVRIDHLWREGDLFIATAGQRRFEAENVVVAMADYQKPRVPGFADELHPEIVQFHSADYRNPAQLQDGDVLLVGGGNSGSEIAMELARHGRHVLMSGRDVGAIPFRIDGAAGRYALVRLVIRFVFHRIITVDTPIGRKVRPKILSQGGPLVRVKPRDLESAGVERVPRTAGIRDGLPVLDDGRVLDVANVIWCTGFHPGFSWIDLPIFDDSGRPQHECGIVPDVPGLYFLGLHFLYSLSSSMIHGIERDSDRIADAIYQRVRRHRTAA